MRSNLVNEVVRLKFTNQSSPLSTMEHVFICPVIRLKFCARQNQRTSAELGGDDAGSVGTLPQKESTLQHRTTTKVLEIFHQYFFSLYE